MSNTDPAIEYLGKEVNVIVDRQLGSKDAVSDYIYGVNFGFVPNSFALNGDEIEAYVLGVKDSIDGFKGQCGAVLHRIDNSGDKLVVWPSDMTFSNEEILTLTAFQEKESDFEIIRVEEK